MTTAAFAPHASPNSLTVEDLVAMSVPELDALYRRAPLPDSVTGLDGTPRGRMLAIKGLDSGRRLAAIAGLAGHARFPWLGKGFSSNSAGAGEGINRTTLIGDVYRFETSIAASAIDGKPAIFLEYDLPENPFFIRAIWDEVREVSPGLFFGPAMLKTQSGPKLVLYFACDNS